MLTLGEVRSSTIVNVAGKCANTFEFSQLLNEATRRLMRQEEETGAIGTFGQNYIYRTTAVAMTGLTDYMDAISIYWNKNVPTIEISDMCVVRFY